MSIADNIKAIIKDNNVHGDDRRNMYAFVAGSTIGTYLGASYYTLREATLENCGIRIYHKPNVSNMVNLTYQADKRTLIIQCVTVASVFISRLAYVFIKPNINLFCKYQRLNDMMDQYLETAIFGIITRERYKNYIMSTKIYSISDVVMKISGLCCAVSLFFQNIDATSVFGFISFGGYLVKSNCDLEGHQRNLLQVLY